VLNLVWEGIFSNVSKEPILRTWLPQATGGIPCQVPAGLLAIPQRTKTERSGRPSTQHLPCEPPARGAYCAPTWLARLVATVVSTRTPNSWAGPVFTGFCPRNSGVISPSALAQRWGRAVSRHLPLNRAGAGAYTLHSFRRGRLQYEHARGMAHDDLMQLAGLSSREILKRYLDQGRHL
jgi:hypothetical protein